VARQHAHDKYTARERITHLVDGGSLPLMGLLEGGGHRIQDSQDSRHFAAANPVFQLLARNSGWVPQAMAMLGRGFAGPTNYAALADFVGMIKGKSTMGMAGPALVKAGLGGDISKEDLGGAQAQTNRNGISYLTVATEDEAIAAIQHFSATCRRTPNNPCPSTPQTCMAMAPPTGQKKSYWRSFPPARANPTMCAASSNWRPTGAACSRKSRPTPETWSPRSPA